MKFSDWQVKNGFADPGYDFSGWELPPWYLDQFDPTGEMKSPRRKNGELIPLNHDKESELVKDLSALGLYQLRIAIERDPEYYSPWTIEDVDQIVMRILKVWDRS